MSNNFETIDRFLALWKDRANNHYQELRQLYLKAIDINQFSVEVDGKFPYQVNNERVQLQYEAKMQFLSNCSRVEQSLLEYYSYDEKVFTLKLTKHLDKEVDKKKKNLITRIEKKVGDIQSVSDLHLGANGEINGVVVGDKSSVNVRTIFAGGYNIQTLHYRVLVKEIV